MKLNKSIYGLKQASSNWFEHFTKGLKARNLFPSQIDHCVYYTDNCIILVYVDNYIVFSSDKSVIDDLINYIKHGNENYSLADEGEVDKYLGVDIAKSK